MSLFSKLAEKSWLAPGMPGEFEGRTFQPEPAAKTGLAMFLAVLTSMFFLFVVGYRMRMMQPDWVPIADPGLLWVNTALLIASSVMMQRAKNAAEEGLFAKVRDNLSMAGVFTIAFLIGQLVAWQILKGSGFFSLTNAPTAFFMLLTGLHALHLMGGLLVWARATWRAWHGEEVKRIRLSVELCTTYWHYLLLVWVVFFALLLMT